MTCLTFHSRLLPVVRDMHDDGAFVEHFGAATKVLRKGFARRDWMERLVNDCFEYLTRALDTPSSEKR